MTLEITVNRKTKAVMDERTTDEPTVIDYEGLAQVLADSFLKWLEQTEKQPA